MSSRWQLDRIFYARAAPASVYAERERKATTNPRRSTQKQPDRHVSRTLSDRGVDTPSRGHAPPPILPIASSGFNAAAGSVDNQEVLDLPGFIAVIKRRGFLSSVFTIMQCAAADLEQVSITSPLRDVAAAPAQLAGV